MAEWKYLQRALGWCLLGFVLTYGLINVVGFLSPFWGQWMRPGDTAGSRALLRWWQPIVPWFSVCFVLSAWHLAKLYRTAVVRVCMVAMGVLVPVAYIGSVFVQRAMLDAGVASVSLPMRMAYLLAGPYLGLAALAFMAWAWWAVRRMAGGSVAVHEESMGA